MLSVNQFAQRSAHFLLSRLRGWRSCQLADLDQGLDRPPLVHCGVGLGHVADIRGQVEDLPGVDLALEDGVNQLRLVVAVAKAVSVASLPPTPSMTASAP